MPFDLDDLFDAADSEPPNEEAPFGLVVGEKADAAELLIMEMLYRETACTPGVVFEDESETGEPVFANLKEYRAAGYTGPDDIDAAVAWDSQTVAQKEAEWLARFRAARAR